MSARKFTWYFGPNFTFKLRTEDRGKPIEYWKLYGFRLLKQKVMRREILLSGYRTVLQNPYDLPAHTCPVDEDWHLLQQFSAIIQPY